MAAEVRMTVEEYLDLLERTATNVKRVGRAARSIQKETRPARRKAGKAVKGRAAARRKANKRARKKNGSARGQLRTSLERESEMPRRPASAAQLARQPLLALQLAGHRLARSVLRVGPGAAPGEDLRYFCSLGFSTSLPRSNEGFYFEAFKVLLQYF